MDFSCFLLFLLACLKATTVIASEMEQKLRNDIFKNRKSAAIRPVQRKNETITVAMGLDISHIIELDEKTEILSMAAWTWLYWIDLTIKWDPNEYGGIQHITVPQDLVWKPDITILNSAKVQKDDSLIANPPVWLEFDGTTIWIPRVTYHTVCPLDLRKFPFDEHVCQLSFCSWTYQGYEVNLTSAVHESSDLSEWMLDEHNQWQVLSARAEREVRRFSDTFEWHFMNFYVHLRRRAPYYGLVIIVPALVAMFMTLVVFWFPPMAPEKISLGSVTILVLVLQLIQLYWVVPRNGGNVPGIVLFCGNSLIFTAVSIVLSMISFQMSRTYAHLPAPARLKNFFTGFLGRILCLTSAEGFLPNVKLFSENAEILTEDKPETSVGDADKVTLPDWIFIATAFDRLCFILYCLIFFILLISSFS